MENTVKNKENHQDNLKINLINEIVTNINSIILNNNDLDYFFEIKIKNDKEITIINKILISKNNYSGGLKDTFLNYYERKLILLKENDKMNNLYILNAEKLHILLEKNIQDLKILLFNVINKNIIIPKYNIDIKFVMKPVNITMTLNYELMNIINEKDPKIFVLKLNNLLTNNDNYKDNRDSYNILQKKYQSIKNNYFEININNINKIIKEEKVLKLEEQLDQIPKQTIEQEPGQAPDQTPGEVKVIGQGKKQKKLQIPRQDIEQEAEQSIYQALEIDELPDQVQVPLILPILLQEQLSQINYQQIKLEYLNFINRYEYQIKKNKIYNYKKN